VEQLKLYLKTLGTATYPVLHQLIVTFSLEHSEKKTIRPVAANKNSFALLTVGYSMKTDTPH